MAELDEHGNPIPGTAAPPPPISGEQREMLDGAGQAYRRMMAGAGGALFTFFMAQRGDTWESVDAETRCVHPETGEMIYVQDLPWGEADLA